MKAIETPYRVAGNRTLSVLIANVRKIVWVRHVKEDKDVSITSSVGHVVYYI